MELPYYVLHCATGASRFVSRAISALFVLLNATCSTQLFFQSFKFYSSESMVWNVFAIYSKSNIQIFFFYSCIFPMPCIVILEIGISFSIRDLVRAKFVFYRFPMFFWYIISMAGRYRLPWKSHLTKLRFFTKAGVIFTWIWSRVDW